MTTQRYYWHNIQINQVHPTSTVAEDDIRGITGNDFFLDGLSEQEFETKLEQHLEGLRASLRVDRVERATIWIHDYTTDDQGETIITEDFDERYSEEDFGERDAA